ncbi:MAG TPA: type II toxin-antitoxin system VapC family toxin [Chthoniobacterales bacterium]|jgi:predicted nucleic acid-binding protein|nr:type II toxin-antitoxin system VapC family toxin [Chthoniobacterales bacterium]
MTAEFVLDGSLTMGWCFEDEASPETDEIQDWLIAGACAYVPTLWHLEIANVLLACERRNRITEADSVRFLAVLVLLNITTDHQTEQHAGKTTLGLARQHGLSVYDAAYLELAMRLGLPLASKDEALREAARAVGLRILPAGK